MIPIDLPICFFPVVSAWHEWLEKNHTQAAGIWVRISKKNASLKSITYAEALDEALCYGWIDSQKKTYDADSYVQKFTPRRKKSIWSQINTKHSERLLQEGRITAAGLKEIEEAKKDGRWLLAYNPASTMQLPNTFFVALAANKKAEAFFKTLNKTNVYAIAWRLQTAKKPETKVKRMTSIIAMLSKGEKFH